MNEMDTKETLENEPLDSRFDLSKSDEKSEKVESVEFEAGSETAEVNEEVHETKKEFSAEDQLKLEIERLNEELNQKNDLLLRKVAEFENMRKRVERERYMTISLAKAEALNEFLPINDDLMRTLDNAKNLTVDEGFLKGVQLVAEKFENVLLKNGIEKINETGVPFDVNVHEALLRQPSPDKNTPSETVLQVFEAGYKMGDRVIRHAKVIVSE